MRVLRVHGGKPKYYHALIGGNFRIDELQAAVLRVKLKYLDGWTAARGSAMQPTTTRLRGGRVWRRASSRRVRLRAAATSTINTWCAPRAATSSSSSSTERGIGTEIYYPVPLHLQQCFAYLGYARGDFPESERAAAETLALPVYPELAQPQLDHVVAASRRSTAELMRGLSVFLKSSGSSWWRDSSL